jgi:hypothetical protein
MLKPQASSRTQHNVKHRYKVVKIRDAFWTARGYFLLKKDDKRLHFDTRIASGNRDRVMQLEIFPGATETVESRI